MNEQDSQRCVVIIGGGFAGLFAARVLRRGTTSNPLIRRPRRSVRGAEPLAFCA